MSVSIVGDGDNGLSNEMKVNADGSLSIGTLAAATDAQAVQDINLVGYNREVQTDATYTYVAHALPGTALSAAGWRAQRIVTATGSRIFAAAGAFTQVATDLTTLTYAI